MLAYLRIDPALPPVHPRAVVVDDVPHAVVRIQNVDSLARLDAVQPKSLDLERNPKMLAALIGQLADAPGFGNLKRFRFPRFPPDFARLRAYMVEGRGVEDVHLGWERRAGGCC